MMSAVESARDYSVYEKVVVGSDVSCEYDDGESSVYCAS